MVALSASCFVCASGNLPCKMGLDNGPPDPGSPKGKTRESGWAGIVPIFT